MANEVKKQNQQITVTPEPSQLPQSLMQIDTQALMQSAIQQGSGVETLERLVALAKDMRAVQAKEAYDHAVAEFQKNCPPIGKTETAKIQTRSGSSYNYSYASLEGITRAISPVLGGLGLSISYRMKHEAGKVIAICRLTHELGHFEESGDVSMPVMTTDGSGANEAQKIGIAQTYAKRYALLAITGIAPEDDPDAGSPVPKVEVTKSQVFAKNAPTAAPPVVKKTAPASKVIDAEVTDVMPDEVEEQVSKKAKENLKAVYSKQQKAMVASFEAIGIMPDTLERYMRKPATSWDEVNLADLKELGVRLKKSGTDGVKKWLDNFEKTEAEVAEMFPEPKKKEEDEISFGND